MKKKYTIIYSHCYHRASMSYTVTKMARVETDDIEKTLAEEEYEGCVNFIFEGHCVEAKD